MSYHHRHWTTHTVGNVGRGMTSAPLDSTHGQHHREMHDIAAFRQHTQSDEVGRGMQSLPLGSTHGRTTSGVACHHLLWATHTVERRRAWNAIIGFGQQTRSNDVGRGMPSPRLDCTQGQTMSGMTCHHRLWTTHTVERRQAWHAIIAVGQHTHSNDVRHGMPSSPLGSTNG